MIDLLGGGLETPPLGRDHLLGGVETPPLRMLWRPPSCLEATCAQLVCTAASPGVSTYSYLNRRVTKRNMYRELREHVQDGSRGSGVPRISNSWLSPLALALALPLSSLVVQAHNHLDRGWWHRSHRSQNHEYGSSSR